MNLDSYTQYRQYMADIAYAFPEIAIGEDGQALVLADDMRKLTRERSLSRYPLMEINRPSLNATIQGSNVLFVYDCEVALLGHCQDDDFLQQEEVLHRIQLIVEKVAAKLIEDRVIFNNRLDVIPIKNTSADNLWGWGMSFQIISRRAMCYEGALDGNDFTVLRFEPQFAPGGQALAIQVEGQTFEVSWGENGTVAKVAAIKALAAQIASYQAPGNAFSGGFSAGFGGGGSGSVAAYHDFGTLVLLSDPGTFPGVDTNVGDHAWEEVDV